jgi:hypothetical protein
MIMDNKEWVFVNNGKAIIIEAESLESATKYYLHKYSLSRKPLHIIEIDYHDVANDKNI